MVDYEEGGREQYGDSYRVGGFLRARWRGLDISIPKVNLNAGTSPKPSWSYLYNAYANAKSATMTVDRWKQIVCQLSYPRFSIFNISGSTYWAA